MPELKERIQHLNNKLRALSNVNRLIACEKDRERLVQKICGLLVENQGWERAWILLTGKDQSFITAVSDGADERFPVLVEQMKRGNYPQCVCDTLIQGQPFTACNDVREQHKGCVLSNCPAGGGAFAARLEHGGKVYGTITIGIRPELVMDMKEQGLFLELVTDLSHALASIESEEERQRAEEALWKSKELYRSLVENINFGITIIDKDFRIIMTNTEICRWSNKSAREFVGKNCFEEFEKRQAVCPHCPGVKAMATGHPAQVETEGVREDDTRFPVKVHAFPVFEADGTVHGFIELIEDITERKHREDEFKKTQLQLIKSGKLAAMGEMAAGIVHELTEPLLGINGFAAALHEDLNDLQVKSAILDHETRKFLEQSAADLDMIRQQTDRMTKIINHVRTFARESGTGKEWNDINPGIENVLALFSQQLRVHNIQVVTNLASGLPRIFCNANELAQVMVNLITNARDAMDAKGQEGQLTITAGKSGIGIYIEVDDTGTGADTETVSHMFEPFFTTKKGVMGLGLSIVHRIITEHGGTINVECRQGAGCKFTIRLPSGGNDKNG
jgi:PAS domain S-box-containing protein